jgi:hypothetical protein
MSITTPRLTRELATLDRMLRLYCRRRHAAAHSPGDAALCPGCAEFLAYAATRLEKCPYGEDKPTCAKCPVHCYKHAQREFARNVMRWAGPRMLLRHPYLAIRHLLDGRRAPPPHPMELRGLAAPKRTRDAR